MRDDLDPDAVERAARAAFVASVLPEHQRYAEQCWDTLPPSHEDREKWARIVRATLAALDTAHSVEWPTGWDPQWGVVLDDQGSMDVYAVREQAEAERRSYVDGILPLVRIDYTYVDRGSSAGLERL